MRLATLSLAALLLAPLAGAQGVPTPVERHRASLLADGHAAAGLEAPGPTDAGQRRAGSGAVRFDLPTALRAVPRTALAVCADAPEETSTDLRETWAGAWAPTGRVLLTYEDGLRTVRQVEAPDGAGWRPVERDDYAYPGTDEVLTRSLWTGAGWEPGARYTFSYDAAARSTGASTETYVGGAWRLEARSTVGYDGAGRPVETVSETWDPAANALVSARRTTTAYGAGTAEAVTETRQGAGAWTPTARRLTTFDATDRPVEALDQEWTGTGWADRLRVLSTYAGDAHAEARTQESVGGAWVDVSRDLVDIAGATTTVSSQSWNVEASAWIDVRQTVTTTDADGRVLEAVTNDGEDGLWVPSRRTRNGFDADGCTTERLDERWDGAAWTLRSGERTDRAYDADGRIERKARQEWDRLAMAWADDSRQRFSYPTGDDNDGGGDGGGSDGGDDGGGSDGGGDGGGDDGGGSDGGSDGEGDGGGGSDGGGVATDEAPSVGLALSVVPNPTAAGGRVRVEAPGGVAVRAELFDARGRRLAVLLDGPVGLEAEVALPRGLAPGVYVVRAVAGDRVEARTVVVR